MEMTYLKFLEEQNALLKDANEQLKEQINSSQTSRLIAENNRLNEICIYWENEHDKLLDENTQLKEQNNVKKLQQRNYKLVVENEFLKEEKTQLKQKINAQSKLIERLITIITDEHYN